MALSLNQRVILLYKYCELYFVKTWNLFSLERRSSAIITWLMLTLTIKYFIHWSHSWLANHGSFLIAHKDIPKNSVANRGLGANLTSMTTKWSTENEMWKKRKKERIIAFDFFYGKSYVGIRYFHPKFCRT